GTIIPNTYYAKVTGVSTDKWSLGLAYFKGLLLAPPFILPVTLGVIVVRWKRWTRVPGLLFMVICSVAYTTYVVWAGGDHMPALRLFVPVMPILWVTSASLIEGATVSPTGKIACGLLLSCGLIVQLGSDTLNPARMDPGAFTGVVIGTWIDENVPEGTTIAVHAAGGTPFTADNRTYIDMLGLNDAHIARRVITETRAPFQSVPGHGKGDAAYVLKRQPDIIIAGPGPGTRVDERPYYLTDVELAETKEFFDQYTLRRVIIDMRAKHPHHRAFELWREGFIEFLYYERNRTP
ncbi:MAG: arabinofuranosyltransferase, partial [Myxococcota bacterium]